MPRKPVNANLKTDLVKALRTALKKEGLEGLEVRKIAREAGCSIGTFYNHYKSLDDLIIYFNGSTLDILSVCMFEEITPKDSAKEVINKICQNYIAFAENNYTEWLLLLEHPLTIEIPMWYKDKSERLFQKVADIFHPILRGPKKDTERAVKILWSSLHGICSLTLKHRLRFRKRHNLLELCQELFHNYILGYRISLERK
jgi:AcrR family transcriptional regulator